MDDDNESSPVWHLSRGGIQYAPLSHSEFLAWVQSGNLRSDDLLWRPGFDAWQPATAIPGLLEVAASDSRAQETAAERAGAGIDLGKLVIQFSGRKFGELVLKHVKKHDLATVLAASMGEVDKLPVSARGICTSWLDQIGVKGTNEAFWRRDCGEVLREICAEAESRLAAVGVPATSDNLFSMFQIAVLNFAYGAHKYPASKAFIQKAIGIGFLRRLFS